MYYVCFLAHLTESLSRWKLVRNHYQPLNASEYTIAVTVRGFTQNRECSPESKSSFVLNLKTEIRIKQITINTNCANPTYLTYLCTVFIFSLLTKLLYLPCMNISILLYLLLVHTTIHSILGVGSIRTMYVKLLLWFWQVFHTFCGVSGTIWSFV